MIDTEDHGRRPLISPKADAQTLKDLGAICPGRSIDTPSARTYDEAAWGPILEVWEGHATDPELRHRGSSGGVVSAIAAFVLESGTMAGVVQVRARKDQPLRNETVISTDREDVLAATASRYSPASPCERLPDVRGDGRAHMFVGKPCDVAGAANLSRRDDELAKAVGLTVSIFCAGTPTLKAAAELANFLGASDPTTVEEIRYRGKGWPGRMSVRYRDHAGKIQTASTSYEEGWGNILQKHKQWRCRLCADHLGDHADLSIGDPWYRQIPKDAAGESLVIVRTERGRRVMQEAMDAGFVNLERRSIEELAASQPNLERTKGAVFARCLTARAVGIGAPRYPGAALHRVWWRALTPLAKAQSVAGTIKRIVRNRIFRTEQARGLLAEGNS
jgi:coenzyme F420 hydrogenase subunit beta